MRASLALLLALGLLPSPALCGDRPVLVLFGLEDPHEVLDRKVRRALAESLAGLLRDCGHDLVGPDEIHKRLKNRFPPGRLPRKRTVIARSLGAWATVVTRIQRTGGGCRLEAFLYNLKRASAEQTNRATAACDRESLAEALPGLAGPLCEYLRTKKFPPRKPGPEKKQKAGAGLEDAAEDLARLAAPEAEMETQAIGSPGDGGPARVSIVTDPEGASVLWDGKKAGRTPLRLDPVEPGWHRLVLEAPGCLPLKESLKIQGSIEMKVGLFLRQRRVRVLTVPPGAAVTVDGRPAGTSPVLVPLRAKQTHRLVARLENHKDTFLEFKPKPATREAPPQEVTIELEARPIYVMVDVHPPGARVEIGSGERREHIVGSGTVGIIPGKRKVVARLEGYVTVEKEVEFAPGKSAELQLRLKPVPGHTDTKETIRSKRIQAFASLGLSAAAFSAVWPLLKWSSDSRRARDEWLQTARETSWADEAQEAIARAGDMDDRVEWTAIVGYAALGVGIASLGWSLYSFLTCPQDPQPIGIAPAFSNTGGLVVFSGSF